MAGNFFDQFDEAPAAAPATPKPAPASGGNFFDQFDDAPAPARAGGDKVAPYGVKGLITGQRSEQPAVQPGGSSAAVARGLVNGVPIIGPLAVAASDRLTAGIRSYENGTGYADELKRIQDFGEETAKENPKATMAAEIAGGVAGMVPAVAAAPAAFGAGAGGLGVRSAASLASGGLIGGADSAVRSGGDVREIAKGATSGAAFGVVAPAAGAVIGAGVRKAGDALASAGIGVPGMSGAAAGKLATDLRNSGGPDAVRGRLTELGPDAMLLDASPSFEGRAQGLAVLPDTREAVTRPLRERAAGANDRLARDLDANVGPAVDPATFTRTLDTEYERVVPRLYGRAFAEPVQVDTRRVFGTLDALARQEKGGAATGLGRARELLMADGPADAAGVPTRIPDTRPEALHNAKEALDAMIATVQAQPGGSARNSELRGLTLTRRALNGALEDQVPGYDFANRTAEHFFRQRAAFNRGQTLLNDGREAVRPPQLAEETAAMTPEVAQAQRDGLRAEIDRLIGTQVNDRVALAKAVKGQGDWNRTRMNTVFGEEPTTGVVSAVERERAFDAANQRITNNSMTALRDRAADDLAPREVSVGSGGIGTIVAGATGGVPGVAAAGGSTRHGSAPARSGTRPTSPATARSRMPSP